MVETFRPRARSTAKDTSYITTEPSYQNVIDLFQGEWLSNLPDYSELVTAPGGFDLFDDERVEWAESVLGDFTGKHILELGPFEGGHSYMLSRRGVHVTAIEANTKSFLKCLCVKEIFNMKNVHFFLGDFVKYLQNTSNSFDVVFASGVLYHMEDPLELLRLISLRTDKLFVWTHYYDDKIIQNNPTLRKKFSRHGMFHLLNVEYEAHRQDYQKVLESKTFCGGPKTYSVWLTRPGILYALKQLGFEKLETHFDTPSHPHGPAFAVCAQKS